jgi:hypothetical protein
MQKTLQEGKQTDHFQQVNEQTLATLFVAFMMGIGMLYHMDNSSFDLRDHFSIVTTNLKHLILHEALPLQHL